jgi:hypothetical protein
MKVRSIAMAIPVALLLGLAEPPAGAQGPAIRPRKPVLIVSGTAMGFTVPGVLLIEELVVHNDGLVTLETASGEKCRALSHFATPAAVEKLRTDLIAAGAFLQEDFNTGQTADLPHTTVTVFRGGASRLDQTSSFTYERVAKLPERVATIRALILDFVETIPEFKKNGCQFPI